MDTRFIRLDKKKSVKVRAVYFEQQFKISFGVSDNKTSSKYSITKKTIQSTIRFLTIEKLHKKISPRNPEEELVLNSVQGPAESIAKNPSLHDLQVPQTKPASQTELLSAFCLWALKKSKFKWKRLFLLNSV